MSDLAPEPDFSIFERAHPGHQWETDRELFGMAGIVVARAVDEPGCYLAPEPDGASVRRITLGPDGPVGWSAKPFDTPEGDTPENFYPFSY